MIPPAPIPVTKRSAISTGSEGAKKQAKLPAAAISSATPTVRSLPARSASGPDTSCTRAVREREGGDDVGGRADATPRSRATASGSADRPRAGCCPKRTRRLRAAAVARGTRAPRRALTPSCIAGLNESSGDPRRRIRARFAPTSPECRAPAPGRKASALRATALRDRSARRADRRARVCRAYGMAQKPGLDATSSAAFAVMPTNGCNAFSYCACPKHEPAHRPLPRRCAAARTIRASGNRAADPANRRVRTRRPCPSSSNCVSASRARAASALRLAFELRDMTSIERRLRPRKRHPHQRIEQVVPARVAMLDRACPRPCAAHSVRPIARQVPAHRTESRGRPH